MTENSRRKFIKESARFTSWFVLLNSFRGSFIPKNEIPTWYNLIDLARWTPSVHNLQPHKVRVISETKAELYYDPQRLLPVGDPESIFATVALGLFAEHLSVAASAYKMKVEVTRVYFPLATKGTDLTLFADLELKPSDAIESLAPGLITKRRTSRLHYDGIPLKDVTLDKVKLQAEQFGHDFSWSSEEKLIDTVIDLNQKTLFEDISEINTRNELDHLFRYTEKEAETKKDGLWAKCMGFPGRLVKSVFQHHDKWEHGLRKKILSSYYKGSFKGTSTVCWFSGRFNDTNDWFYAGRMLARTWLLFTQENAYIHPFGSLITNKRAYKKINEVFPQPAANKKLWMVFRAGHSREPARSFRLATNEIIVS